MKRIFTLFVFALTVSTANSATIRHTYSIGDPVIRSVSNFKTINFEDMILSGKAGEPVLPWYAVKLLLPPGQEAVSIKFEGSNMRTIEGNFRLYPMQHSRPLSDNSPVSFVINNDLYKSATGYPESQTGVLSTHFMNGYAYALSTFTPVRYNPAEGTISYFQTVTITIETQSSEKASIALNNLSSNERINKKCLSFAQNPDISIQYPVKGRNAEDRYDILIITPESFRTQINRLVQHYRDQGLKSRIASTQYIDTHFTGIDMAEKMRNYIIQEYQNNGIEHVILAGDVELVAYRGFYCSVQSSSLYEDYYIPSDLYFSGLDGNWNTDGDERWAEIGEDDLLPDISVGRMSFSNSLELEAMLNKTIKYQTSPVENELNNHLLAGEFLYDNPETWGSDYLELLIGYRDENGYVTKGIPENYPVQRLYDETTPWMSYDLISIINSGKSFISHVGHANSTYTMKLTNWDITNDNFNGVDGISHNFPIVYTHGCICGAFDESDCIAERMVAINNFAAAFVGNSRYGWFNEGQNEGPSAHIHREFIDALFTDSLNRIGRAHLESKIATAPWVNAPGQWEEGALRWCFYDCNVLGDPVMAIWSDLPLQISTTYPVTIPVESTSFNVSVANQGHPVKNLTVALIKDNKLIAKGYTDKYGIATIAIDTLISQPGPAVINVSGYNCKVTTYETAFALPTGIIKSEESIASVFPNPAGDMINVDLLSSQDVKTIIMKDITGRIVGEYDCTSTTSLNIRTTGLQKGTYFLYFIGNKNEVVKVIIQ